MKFLLIFFATTLLVSTGYTNPNSDEDSVQTEVKQGSNKKLSRIRALFERLKAIQARGRSRWESRQEIEESVPEEEAVESRVVREPSENSGSDFDRFLFEDPDAPSVPPQAPVNEENPGPDAPGINSASSSLESRGEEVFPMGDDGEQQYEYEDIEKKESPQASQEMRYVVQPGDALLLIARKIYRDPKKYKEIMAWNDLKSVNLVPNQVLELRDVPSGIKEEYEKGEELKKDSLFPPASYKYKVYKVGYGDSLARIATRFLGSQTQYLNLAKLNEIDPEKVLYVGQKMIIPVRK